MVLDDFGGEETGRKLWRFVTPFTIASAILLLISAYVVCLEYIKAPRSADGLSLVLALFSVCLATSLVVADRHLLKRMKYLHLFALEAVGLVLFVAMLAV